MEDVQVDKSKFDGVLLRLISTKPETLKDGIEARRVQKLDDLPKPKTRRK